MFVLDTNVVSELMEPAPNPLIKSWVAEHIRLSLFLTTVTEAELRAGIVGMSPSKRRDRLQTVLEHLLEISFVNRILPFDSNATQDYAEIHVARRNLGRRIETADCQIAAIARVHGMSVATRNVKDFVDTGVKIFNPWEWDGM